jgi:hypothetical protein
MRRLKRAAVCLPFLLVAAAGDNLDQTATSSNSERSPVQVRGRAETDRPLSANLELFWHREPNYVYAPNGKKLLGELAAFSPVPVYFRPHNLFTTGNGDGSLKWGSTNVYTERPVAQRFTTLRLQTESRCARSSARAPVGGD